MSSTDFVLADDSPALYSKSVMITSTLRTATMNTSQVVDQVQCEKAMGIIETLILYITTIILS